MFTKAVVQTCIFNLIYLQCNKRRALFATLSFTAQGRSSGVYKSEHDVVPVHFSTRTDLENMRGVLSALFCSTPDHTKFIGSFKTQQDFIDVVEVVLRGALHGKLIVTSPLDPRNVPKYTLIYKDIWRAITHTFALHKCRGWYKLPRTAHACFQGNGTPLPAEQLKNWPVVFQHLVKEWWFDRCGMNNCALVYRAGDCALACLVPLSLASLPDVWVSVGPYLVWFLPLRIENQIIWDNSFDQVTAVLLVAVQLRGNADFHKFLWFFFLCWKEEWVTLSHYSRVDFKTSHFFFSLMLWFLSEVTPDFFFLVKPLEVEIRNILNMFCCRWKRPSVLVWPQLKLLWISLMCCFSFQKGVFFLSPSQKSQVWWHVCWEIVFKCRPKHLYVWVHLVFICQGSAANNCLCHQTWRVSLRFSIWPIRYFLKTNYWKPSCLHLPHPVGMWNFAQAFSLAIFHENRGQKSCDFITSTVFQIQKFEKTDKKTFMNGKRLVWHFCLILCIVYGWNHEDVRWDFFYSNPLGSYEQAKFFRLIAKLRLFITFQWIWIEKIPPYISLFHP